MTAAHGQPGEGQATGHVGQQSQPIRRRDLQASLVGAVETTSMRSGAPPRAAPAGLGGTTLASWSLTASVSSGGDAEAIACRDEAVSCRTRPARQRLQAAPPVACASHSVSTASRSSVVASGTDPVTSAIVAGSCRSRRVASDGSSRWWRTSQRHAVRVCGVESPTAGTPGAPGEPQHAVVDAATLADVVQERGDDEQVGRLTWRMEAAVLTAL
jgi:hypothetical protein